MNQHHKGPPPKEKEPKEEMTTAQRHDGYTFPASHSGASQYSSTSQEKAKTELPPNPAPEERPNHILLADLQQAPFSVDGEDMFNYPMRTISSPYMLQRFLTIDTQNDALRHEANAGILEGRVYEGEDMMHRRMYEEGWEEVDAVYENIIRDLERSSEKSGPLQSTLQGSSTEMYPQNSEAFSN